MIKKSLKLSVLMCTAYTCIGAATREVARDTYVPEQTVSEHVRPSFANRPIIVAVIDTGLDIEKFKDKVRLCNFGHKDLTGFGIEDDHSHGTHISGVIEQYASGSNYCQVIIKFYDPKMNKENTVKNTIDAFKHALELNVDVINYSGGGIESNFEERKVIKKILDSGIKIVAAAGNESCSMGKSLFCTFYPAEYDNRIIVVGNLSQNRVPAKSTNIGNMVQWEIGTNVLSLCWSDHDRKCYMSGSSQATATRTGKIVKSMDDNRGGLVKKNK